MAKVKTKFCCQECGYISPKWLGKCPGCEAWNSMVEEIESTGTNKYVNSSAVFTKQKAKSVIEIGSNLVPRIITGNMELDRVLGGGIVPGSLILVGGDPGIGKSTLLMQISHALASQKLTVLYVTGEESTAQTRMRAERLNALCETMYILCETNLEFIEEAMEELKPDILMIDSIQTVYHPAIASAPGSVAQVRECTGHFMRISKICGVAVILVGHVTKDGAIAGPRTLEHMVDCVLYFEGERHNTYRMLRTVKNRFGARLVSLFQEMR